MALIPNPRSFQQILGDMLDAFLARIGVSDLHEGSAVLSIFEAAAQSDFRSSEDIFAVLAANSIDRAGGEGLDKLGADEDVYRLVASPATGSVTLTDTNFTKLATKIYPGTTAPNVGSITINVSDASDFPFADVAHPISIYLGRNTSNFEGPIKYTNKAQVGSYWQLTLLTGTTKYHNLSESVILAHGGNRAISAGTLVQTAQGNVSTATQFQTTVSVVLPDGEDTLTDVPVVALGVGSVGNVPRGSVVEFPSSPFPNLAVTNPLPFVTGSDQESDVDFRARIKKAIQSRVKGTDLAIESAVLGITSRDEPKRVVSSSIVKQAGYPSRLIIDDSAGYEELTAGVGLVSVVDSALGGEQFLQLPNRAISKAALTTILSAPFVLADQDKLAVLVGSIRSEHTFVTASFKNIANATAYEVASSINDNSLLLFSAMTAAGGTQVRIFAKADDNEDIEVVTPSSGVDANENLGFVLFKTNTLNLYKNDVLLYKDGIVPEVFSVVQSSWSPTISDGETLQVRVDGVSVATTYTINDLDFVAAGTGYPTVSAFNSLASWATVLNYKIPGIAVEVSGAQLVLRSNRGANTTASVEIVGGTLFTTQNMFSTLLGISSFGRASDYELNRNTGQLTLVTPLTAGDSITAGSQYTRGYVQTANLTAGLINFSFPANFWVVVDGQPQAISIAIPATATLTVSNPSGNIWRYRIVGDATAFTNVVEGDWLIVWDPSVTDTNNIGFWRVCSTGVYSATDSFVEVEKSTGTATSYTLGAVGTTPGIVVVRSTEPMQQITLASGISTLSAIVTSINSQILGALASVVESDNIRLTTLSFGSTGSIMMVTTDLEGQRLLFTDLDLSTNKVSHTAFVESANSDLGTPLFVHDPVATGNAGEPPTGFVSTVSYPTVALADQNDQIGFLRPYGAGRFSSNHNNYTQLKTLVTTTATLNLKDTVHEILVADRTFAARPFDLDSEDSIIAELDQDAVNKTFSIAMARKISIKKTPTPPTSTTFDAYDLDRGPTALLSTTFGTGFKFDNFKLWMHARNLINPAGVNNALIYRCSDFGPSGNNYRVGYFYPTAPGAAMSSSVTTGQYVSVQIYLPSGSARALTPMSAAAKFNITKSGGGPYTITYTYSSGGTAPDFVASGVLVGDIFTDGFSANHKGTYRITARTATTLTIVRSTDPGADEAAVTVNVMSLFQIYPLASNLANDVITYVTASLSTYLTVEKTLEDPAGSPNMGTGAIVLSTEDELGSVGTLYVSLVDGENWILSTALPGLTLKMALQCFDPLYVATIQTDQFKLIPTTADQLSRYLNVLGTSGITTIAGLTAANHGNKLQIYSDVLGSGGAVQITGGTGNTTVAEVVGSGVVVDTSYTAVRVPSSLRQGFHAKQFVRVVSTAVQPKVLAFSATTTLQVAAASPNAISITAGTGAFKTVHTHSGDGTTVYQVEKQGSFWCVSYCGIGTSPAYSTPIEGDWVTLSTGFAPVNQGTFRVVRRYANSFYIENPVGIEEVSATGASIEFTTYDSVIVGDTLKIGGTILGNNAGNFIVTVVDSSTLIHVVGTMVNNGPTVLGAAFNQVQILEKAPFEAIKRIHLTATNPTDPNQLDVVLDGAVLPSKITEVALASLVAQDKLGFSIDINQGLDGYRKYLGLIAEANRVVYGDPTNSTTYPGVAACGAYLNIEGPVVKRISVSLAVRVRTGVPFDVVQAQIKTNVAAVINKTPVGTSIVISDLVTAAGKVSGVLAVSMVSPAYDDLHDLISIAAVEKPLVIDVDADVLVSQIGG